MEAVDEEASLMNVLKALLDAKEQPPMPIQSHAERIPSSQRGVSIVFLRVLRAFYTELGAINKLMGDVCKEEGSTISVCALTRSTGLSLSESVLLKDRRVALPFIKDATTFFSYSWTDTRLGDMLDAVERKMAALEREDGRTRYVFIDMICVSQNLVAGVFLSPRVSTEYDRGGEAAVHEELEDIRNLMDSAMGEVGELLFYCSPLMESWTAPRHPYLLPDRGEPPEPWTRRGPAAMTRAWCIFEVARAIANKCKVLVVLSAADEEAFEGLLLQRFDEIADIIAALDARDAQITKVEDREYILEQAHSGP